MKERTRSAGERMPWDRGDRGVKLKEREAITNKRKQTQTPRRIRYCTCVYNEHMTSWYFTHVVWMLAWQDSYSFVGLLLAGMFRGFAGVRAHLHVHGIDDVEEIFHHRHALQGRVHPGHSVHTLETQGETLWISSSLSACVLQFTTMTITIEEDRVECNKDFQPESNQERLQVTGKRPSKCDQKYLTKCLNLLLRINPSWQKHDLRHRDNIGRVKTVWLVASRNSQTQI